MQREQEQHLLTLLDQLILKIMLGTMITLESTATTKHMLLQQSLLTRLDYLICMEMYGNGYRMLTSLKDLVV